MQFSFMLPDSRAGPLPPAPEMSLSSADLSEASLFFLLTYQPGDNLLEKKKKIPVASHWTLPRVTYHLPQTLCLQL